MILGFGNNISGAIATSITASQTVIPVTPGTGVNFAKALTYASYIPASISGSVPIFAKVTLTDTQETVFEICHLISVSGDNLTVIRGQEGTTAKGWSLNDTIANFATKGSEDRFVQIEELQRGFYLSATATGTANAMVVALPSTLGENSVAGATANFSAPVIILPTLANTSNVTVTVSVGGLSFPTNAPLLKGRSQQLSPGDVQPGEPLMVLWSEADASWYHITALGSNAYATVARVQAGNYLYSADAGAVNAYVGAFNPALTAVTDGSVLRIKAAAMNTGASTFAPASGITAAPIYDTNYAALQGGEIGAGGEVWLQWNAALGAWILIASAGGVSLAAQPMVGPSNRIRNITGAGSTLTGWVDDAVIVGILGSSRTWKISSFTASLSLSTVGIGGMDTGAAVANGYLLVYAAYNPATKAYGVFAQMESATTNDQLGAPATYKGTHLPAGYTATALISIVPVGTSATTFGAFTQTGRKVRMPQNSIINLTSYGTTLSWQSVASSSIPYGALTIDGFISATSNYSGGAMVIQGGIAPIAAGSGGTQLIATSGTGLCANDNSFIDVPIHNPRNFSYFFFNSVSASAAVLGAIIFTGFSF